MSQFSYQDLINLKLKASDRVGHLWLVALSLPFAVGTFFAKAADEDVDNQTRLVSVVLMLGVYLVLAWALRGAYRLADAVQASLDEIHATEEGKGSGVGKQLSVHEGIKRLSDTKSRIIYASICFAMFLIVSSIILYNMSCN